MNTSSWKKAADIVAKMTPVTPQASAAAMVELHNLQSLQLSTLSIDDSGPPHVPGMSSRLYPTLVADSSLEAHVSDQQDTLQMQLTTEVDKYLQESAEK